MKEHYSMNIIDHTEPQQSKNKKSDNQQKSVLIQLKELFKTDWSMKYDEMEIENNLVKIATDKVIESNNLALINETHKDKLEDHVRININYSCIMDDVIKYLKYKHKFFNEVMNETLSVKYNKKMKHYLEEIESTLDECIMNTLDEIDYPDINH